jgi:hypothetical protein
MIFGKDSRNKPIQDWRRTVFQISASKELVIEGKATIRKRVAEVDEQYKVEFAHKPGVTYERSSSSG